MRIGIDIDGVIANTFPLLVRELNNFFNKNLSYDEIIDYDIGKVYNIEREQLVEFAQLKQDLLLDGPAPVPNALECINNLRYKAFVALISARMEKSRQRTENWLQRHGFYWDELILLGNHDKAETCVKLELDFFIEDRLDNALQVGARGIPVLLLDAPYNRAPLPSPARRVHSWSQICKIITSAMHRK
ncbi:5' nucleotidase, NT5C type [Desulfoscipio gibsoniae]|uniref:Nucleotidase n=1 Tax=Desulfoscipio gibsoniae DSM 7213 TaxID=767817 RepID=R4KM39_9FIRM|nr:hypothetical protein [Desulfoscipio gibsoniae]AGL01585.1 hypothetical protein Desgi_2152 [Desulfoscipio gibsoniae DSM 7213]